MVDTPRTIAFLTASEFQDGQAVGAITPQFARDLIVTLKARTGGGKVNLVTAPEYGADPTGVSDSTAAFAAALAGPSVALIPPGTYKISNLVVPTGSSLIGMSSLGYGSSSGVAGHVPTLLVAKDNTAVRVLNVDSQTNILLQGFQIDCDFGFTDTTNASCDGISAGCTMLTVRDVTVRRGRFGIGGAVGAGVTTSSLASLRNVQIYGCVTGLGDLANGFVSDVYLSFCTNGAIFSTPSKAITITGGRVEWNSNYGIEADNMADLQINGVLFDANSVCGLYLNGTSVVSLVGNEFKRNGRNLDTNSCHILFNSATNVTASGNTSRHGQDNSGAGNDGPAVWAREQGTSDAITFVGNDLSGITGTGIFANIFFGNTPAHYTFAHNHGMLMDERSDGSPIIAGGFHAQGSGLLSVAGGATSVLATFNHDPVSTFDGAVHTLDVYSRDQATGGMNAASFRFLILRQGASPTLSQSAVYGQIGTAGYIAFGSGTLQLSWTSIASDASTYSLTGHNTTGDILDIHVFVR